MAAGSGQGSDAGSTPPEHTLFHDAAGADAQSSGAQASGSQASGSQASGSQVSGAQGAGAPDFGAGRFGAQDVPAHDVPAQGGRAPSDPSGAGHPGSDEAAVAAVPGDDIPEELSDPAVALQVAALDDEVVVVDEQPRYHLSHCRSLDAQAPIPLPVREAVELGFSPCAWCAPNRTLSSRHTAEVR